MLRRASRYAFSSPSPSPSKSSLVAHAQPRFHGSVSAGDVKGPWGAYLRFLSNKPVWAGLFTGLTLWTIGDCVAQRLDAGKGMPFDPRRAFATGLFGGVVAGAIASEWYRLLEHLATKRLGLRHGGWRFVAFKLGMEFIVWHPISLVTFWFTVGLIDGKKDTTAIRNEIAEEFRPTILTEYALWLPLDFVNFWKVPVKYQVAVVNLGCFVESIMLSYIHENGFPKIFGDSTEVPAAPAPIISELGTSNKYGDQPSRVLAWQRAIRPNRIAAKFGRKFSDIEKQIDKEWPKGDLTRDHVERVMKGEACLPGLKNDALSVTCSGILHRKMAAEGRDTVPKEAYVRFIKAFQESGFRMKVLAEVCFALFDADNDGFLDEAELKSLISVVAGKGLDSAALNQMVAQLPSARVSKKDFVDIMSTPIAAPGGVL